VNIRFNGQLPLSLLYYRYFPFNTALLSESAEVLAYYIQHGAVIFKVEQGISLRAERRKVF